MQIQIIIRPHLTSITLAKLESWKKSSVSEDVEIEQIFSTSLACWNHLGSFKYYCCLSSTPRDPDVIILGYGLGGCSLKSSHVFTVWVPEHHWDRRTVVGCRCLGSQSGEQSALLTLHVHKPHDPAIRLLEYTSQRRFYNSLEDIHTTASIPVWLYDWRQSDSFTHLRDERILRGNITQCLAGSGDVWV